MKRAETKFLKIIGVAIVSAFAAAPALAQQGPPGGVPSGVNCARPNASVQDAVNKASPGTVITIEGTCFEDVTITTDDLTLQGDPAVGGAVSGTITIFGARRVVIDDLRVTGAGNGIHATNGASFTVQNNSAISDNDETGIWIRRTASGEIRDSEINNNGQNEVQLPGGWGGGFAVTDGASAFITNNVISNNLSDGIWVGDQGTAEINFNVITGNGRPGPFFDAGIDVGRGAHVRSRGNTISDNGYAGIEVFDGATLRQGLFLADESQPEGHGIPDPADTDKITQKGCPSACVPGTVAVDLFTGANADFKKLRRFIIPLPKSDVIYNSGVDSGATDAPPPCGT